MSEGGGKGKMCFCEENECNGAEAAAGLNLLAILLPAALLTLSSLLWDQR